MEVAIKHSTPLEAENPSTSGHDPNDIFITKEPHSGFPALRI